MGNGGKAASARTEMKRPQRLPPLTRSRLPLVRQPAPATAGTNAPASGFSMCHHCVNDVYHLRSAKSHTQRTVYNKRQY